MATFKEAIRRIEVEVRDYIVSRPDLSYPVIGQMFGVSDDTILKIAKKFNLRRKVGRKNKPVTNVPKAV
jgi:hypothetical protein